MSTTTTQSGLSARDRKLLMAFGLFAEAVLLYMLLIDPMVTRLMRAQELEVTTRRAHTELAAAVKPKTQAALSESASSSLAPLQLAPGETPTIAIQQMVGEMAKSAGARLLSARVERVAKPVGGLSSHGVNLELAGSYESIAAFIDSLEAPEPVRGVELIAVSASEADPGQLRASLTLRFYLP